MDYVQCTMYLMIKIPLNLHVDTLSNANYTSNQHESIQSNQSKCSLMQEHIIDDAICINIWPRCLVNTNAQEYMHAMYKNPHTDTNNVAKSNSNQRIQE